jgi:hypothetical protein
MTLFLILIVVALALGLAGVLIKGLFYLLIAGIVILALDLVLGGHHLGKRRGGRLPR